MFRRRARVRAVVPAHPFRRRQPRPARANPAPAEPPHPRRRVSLRLLRWAAIAAIWGVLALAGMVLWLARDLPRPAEALAAARRPSLTVLDRDGRVIGRFGDIVGEKLRLSDFPPWLPEAAVAIEDRRFWSHPGFDPLGLARAAWADVRAGHVVQGGSTITQQVAKNLFLGSERSLKRKVQEILLTLWLEQKFDKREILDIWLNRAYFGAGAWGIDAAARVYFGISARHANLWQAAVLAGLPRAPSRLNPRVDPEAAAARGREVLAAMVQTGAISAEQARRASARIAFPPDPPRAGWFADWAAEQAQAVLPPGTDAVLHSTLDSRLQSLTQQRLDTMLRGPGAAGGASQGAVVVLDADTGAVRVMVGGRDYGASTYNRAVAARRQPGSAFKPFVWLAALEHGMRPESEVLDVPIRLGKWSPANFEHRYRGEITIEEALAQSSNVAAVRLLLRAGGPQVVAAVAHRLGIADKLPDNASLALGTGEVGLLELAAAYAPFFNGGHLVRPTGLVSVVADRRALPLPRAVARQVISADDAAAMARMLDAVVARGTGHAAALPGRAIGGKTGTTQDERDAWFVGCVGGEIIGVWIGNDRARPMHGITGGSLPARLFHEIAASIR